MSRFLPILALVALLVTACATQPPGGLARPGLLTNPKGYLETVGLDKHTKADVAGTIGTPDKTVSADGKDYWTYQLADEGARARYTYVFEGEKLVDVRYNQDRGSFGYDGRTARELQGK